MQFPRMKTQVSAKSLYSHPIHQTAPPLPHHGYMGKLSAVIKYRECRENGSPDDDPSRDFPNDGDYSFFKDSESHNNYVTYIEGLGDKDWMEEKDRIYLERLLTEAVKNDELETVNEFLANKVDVNTTTLRKNKPDYLPPLFYAVLNGQKRMVELLLAHGADITFKDSHGRTVANLAQEHNHNELAGFLLATSEKKSEDQKTQLTLDEMDALLEIWETTIVPLETPLETIPTDSSFEEEDPSAPGHAEPDKTPTPAIIVLGELFDEIQQTQIELEKELKKSEEIQLWLLEQKKRETLDHEKEALAKKVAKLEAQEKELTEALSESSEASEQELKALQFELAVTKANQSRNLRELTDFDQRMSKAESSLELLMHYHYVKLRHHENLKRFSPWPNALLYYSTLQRLIENTFISSKAVTGNKAEVKGSDTSGWIKFLTNAGYLIPVVGEGVAGAASAGVGHIDKKREENKAERTDRINLSKMMDIAILVAERLTDWFFNPLCRVATLEEEKAYVAYLKTQPTEGISKKSKKTLKKATGIVLKTAQRQWHEITLSNKPEPAIVELARAAKDLLDRLLESEAQPDENESLDSLMVHAVTDIPLDEPNTWKKRLKSKVKERFAKTIHLKERSDDTEVHELREIKLLDLYTRPGLQSPNGRLYRHMRADCSPTVYGYCIAESNKSAERSARRRRLKYFCKNKRPDFKEAQRLQSEGEEKAREEEEKLKDLIKDQRARMEKERQEQKEELKKHDERVAELKKLHETADTAAKAGRLISITLQSKEAEIEKAKNDAEKANRKVLKLEKQVATLELEKSNLKSQVTELASIVASMQMQMKQLLDASGQLASATLAPTQIVFRKPESEESAAQTAESDSTPESDKQHAQTTGST